jgi:ATP-dependent helicase IRC3
VLVWGCSATVRRHDGVALEAVFDSIAFKRDMKDMWQEGWLAPLIPRAIKTSIDLSHVPSQNGDFSESKLALEVNTPKRNAMIVEAWLKFARPTRKSTLVFGVDVQHTKDLVSEFTRAGVEAHAITGNTPAQVRQQLLEAFRAQEFPVLINCSIFTEGTDIPCIDCIVMARPTKSSVLFQQMVGRGLRLYDNKPDCLCLDIVDNMGRNTIYTAPTLMGLTPEFDTQGSVCFHVELHVVNLGAWSAGESVMAAYEKIKKIALVSHSCFDKVIDDFV